MIAPRIVSLVPSLTELCFDLGLDDRLVGRTDYCIAPAGRVGAIPALGGPGSVDAARLATLAPTHVLISPEENGPAAPGLAAACGAEAVSVQPQRPEDNRDLYRRLGALFGCEREAEALVSRLDAALAEAAACRAGTPRLAVLPLLWKDPWVSAGADTYVGAMLAAVGMGSVAPDPRYPRLADLAEAAAAADWVLPTTEPYPFSETDAATLRRTLARATVEVVDGEALAWYGSRAISALPALARLKRGLLDRRPART
ncbi:ABC-type Fe3+-hydroxamate transport system, periplasmic component [uncultured Alphaproteobacteria bacterium]|uniref:ABC-type Fe3+-hydroxamate transport system, periplasmic component n=1 Tax=uncultured Alphaproteobacteria bacterium TaxID=91750 RepID=A0A212JAR3_9PROT|nr:ABC-type Fe3+-hydroxamate transport system, periplasmic component [uncultured Alphaproteobacteria bacterium]